MDEISDYAAGWKYFCGLGSFPEAASPEFKKGWLAASKKWSRTKEWPIAIEGWTEEDHERSGNKYRPHLRKKKKRRRVRKPVAK